MRTPLLVGECLRSAQERDRLLSGNSPPRRDGMLEGVARGGLDWCLPTGLQALACKGTTYPEKLSAEQLVRCHTHAPYFLSTLGPSRGLQLVNRLLVPVNGPTRPILPVALSEWFTKKTHLVSRMSRRLHRGIRVLARTTPLAPSLCHALLTPQGVACRVPSLDAFELWGGCPAPYCGRALGSGSAPHGAITGLAGGQNLTNGCAWHVGAGEGLHHCKGTLAPS